MKAYHPTQPWLQRAWERLSPSRREVRLGQARKREGWLKEVAAKGAQESEQEALARVAPGVTYASFKRWKDRYAAYGLDGLVDARISPQSPLSAEVAAELCTLRRADP